ncbi:MAG: triose-phosphate isomerase [Selenomonadales bacterium]|jgi:triose-phosphate isomerase|nr:triose-phosphate isomerase [Clostridiales bacterium]PWL97955.1 MAG: triose-phosphate isomerase [Selenomonadales bacterium]
MRKPIITGNWKMNKTPKETAELINQLKPLVAQAECEVVVCPPAVCLAAAAEALKGSNIKLGAQNVHWARSGAFTGEISADMLKALDVEYVILGHSERRQYFGETDEGVNKRALFALSNGLIPIICVGESLEQREKGVTAEVVSSQVREALKGFTAENAADTVIAYEPIWAIGTGKTATSEQANEVIMQIRGVVRELFGEETAEKTRIQYGGSMNPKNASELMGMSDIDGGLIGGASLKAEDFAAVVNF